MSIDSFKKTIWEAELIRGFRGVAVAEAITTPPTKIEGNKVIFNRVSGGSIKDYTGKVEYEDITTTPTELTLNTKKYFAIQLDDVDAVQQVADTLRAVAQEKALDLKEVNDGIVFTEATTSVKPENTIGSKSTKKKITSPSQAYDFIVDLGVKLSKKKVPFSNRFVIASSEFVQLMAKDARFTDNLEVLPNGIVQGATINGMTIIISEDVPANTVICLHKSAIGYAMQLEKLEAIRREGSFSDAIRGLEVLGKVTLRPEAIAVLYYEVAEPLVV